MRVGPYEIAGELGRGATGAVFRANGPGGVVALKLLRFVTPDALARFERERRVQQALGSELGFVPILGAGESPAGPWLALPLLEGGSLRTRLDRGPLPDAEATALVTRLATALGHAHARGLVHRDLKPENVLFDTAGLAFVADLGLAKHFLADVPGASGSVSLSKSGAIRGTAGYMPPEQMRDAKVVGPAADVFALGAILFECLHGAPAFSGESVLDLLGRVERGEREPFRSDLSPGLRSVVAAALSANPAARPRDGDALARALDAAARGGGKRARGPLLVGGLVLAAAALAATAAVLSTGAGAGPRGTRIRSPGSGGTPRGGPDPTPDASPSSAPALGELVARGDGWLQHAGRPFAVGFEGEDVLVSVGEDGLRRWDLARRRSSLVPLVLEAGALLSEERALGVNREGELIEISARTGERRAVGKIAPSGVLATGLDAARDGSAAVLIQLGKAYAWRRDHAAIEVPLGVSLLPERVRVLGDGRALLGARAKGANDELHLFLFNLETWAFPRSTASPLPRGKLFDASEAAGLFVRTKADISGGTEVLTLGDFTAVSRFPDRHVAGAFSPDGRHLGLLSERSVEIYEGPAWSTSRSIPAGYPVLSIPGESQLALSNGGRAAVATEERGIDLLGASTPKKPVLPTAGAITALAFSGRSDALFSGDARGTLSRWEVGLGEPRLDGTLPPDRPPLQDWGVRALAVAADGSLLVAVADEVRRLPGGRLRETPTTVVASAATGPILAGGGPVTLATLTGGLLVAAPREARVFLRQGDRMSPLDTRLFDTLVAAGVASNGHSIAVLAHETAADRVGRWTPGSPVRWAAKRPERAACAAFSGDHLLVGSTSDTLTLEGVGGSLDPPTRLASLSAAAVALSPRWALAATTQALQVFRRAGRTATLVAERALPEDVGRPTALAVSPDERRLAVGTSRGVLLFAELGP